jgi:hypothetical protein
MIKVSRREDLEGIFTPSKTGWRGSDGIYCLEEGESLLWYFSDTLSGPKKEMIHNCYGFSSKEVHSVSFKADRAFLNAPGLFYWPQDCYQDGEDLYFFCLALEEGKKEEFPLAGVDLVKVRKDKERLIQTAIYKIPALGIPRMNLFLGSDVTWDETYVYVYGYVQADGKKQMIVYRMLKEGFPEERGSYLTENGWSERPEKLKILASDISPEFQIYRAGSKYYLAYISGSVSGEIYLTSADSPFDFFPPGEKIYTCPEQGPKAICYNAKIQTALSNQKRLIISYHVNALQEENLYKEDIYRPHFLEVTL